MTNKILAALTTFFLLPAIASASIVFVNDFEDGNINPDVGSWTINNTPTTSVVATANAGTNLGSNVGLIDQGTGNLSIDLGFADGAGAYECLDLSGGNTVVFSFDIAARRTNGLAKTTLITAKDIDNVTVAQFVLGDSNAFGNGGIDRQRPGYGTSTGRTQLADDFYWGADTSVATFDTNRDAHFDLTFSATGMAINGVRQTGANDLTATAPTWDGGTYDNIASFSITGLGANNGMYWDNITVDASNPILVHVPEPSSVLILLAIGGIGIARRKR